MVKGPEVGVLLAHPRDKETRGVRCEGSGKGVQMAFSERKGSHGEFGAGD